VLEINLSDIGASEKTVNAVTTVMVDVLQVITTLNYFPRNDDVINQNRLEPWLRRNRRLPTLLAGVQELVHHPSNNNNNNNNNNTINLDALLMRVLRIDMEDIGREKSATFLLIRYAILGGGRQDQQASATHPLHDAIVDFLQSCVELDESAAVAALPWYSSCLWLVLVLFLCYKQETMGTGSDKYNHLIFDIPFRRDEEWDDNDEDSILLK
jgi:hypothetical protein